MKHLMTFLAVFTLIFCTACGRDDNPTPSDPSTPSGTPVLKMKINGVQWESSKATIMGISQADGKYNLTLTGMDEDFGSGNSQMSLIFSNPTAITPGTYAIKDLEGGASITKVDGKTYMVVDYADEEIYCIVEITQISETGGKYKLKGTFSGVFEGPTPGEIITVTDGQFSN